MWITSRNIRNFTSTKNLQTWKSTAVMVVSLKCIKSSFAIPNSNVKSWKVYSSNVHAIKWKFLFLTSKEMNLLKLFISFIMSVFTKDYLHYQILCFYTQNRIILLQSLVCISCPYLEARACNLFLIKCEKRFFV